MIDTNGRYLIPAVEIPFQRNRHIEQDLAHQMTKKWAVTHSVMSPDLVPKFLDDLHYTDLIGGYYVGAPLPVLTAINDFSLWFFVWDDLHDHYIRRKRHSDWSRLRDDLHLALDEPQRCLDHAYPLVAAFSDSVVRLCEPLSSRWSARFKKHFHGTIEAYDQEYRNRTTGTIPTVEEYLTLRRHTFGMWVWIDCLELAAEFELPDAVYCSAPYQAAALAAQEFSAWYNDLHSMPKEIAADDFHNLGMVLAHQNHLSNPQASQRVARQVQNRVVEYQQEELEVLRLLGDIHAGPELRAGTERCLFNMRNWISSVYWFHYESGRYRIGSWDNPANPPYVGAPDGQISMSSKRDGNQ